MISVRHAIDSDYTSLLRLGVEMINEAVTPFPEIEPDRVRKSLDLTLHHPDMMMCGLAEDNDLAVGFITGMAGDHAFSSARRSASDLLYVTPTRRGAVAAKQLIKLFLEWSDDQGCGYNTMGTTTGVQPERTGLLFERMGFNPVGAVYRRDV